MARRNLISPVLVGRDAELAVLTDALEAAVAGDPSVVIVGGEAGVGKTRLVEEAAAGARATGARVLTGGCVELGGEGLPFSPLVDALRTLVRTEPPDELDAFVGPARSELARLLPELDPETALGSLSPTDTGNARLLELSLGVIQRLAAHQPLMFVIEDLHWADQSTLDLVALLVRALRGVRVLLVLSVRSDELHRDHPLRPLLTGWERVRSVQRLELERFDRGEVAAQLSAILGEQAQRGVLDLVYERSEGNAFLVEEILGAVQAGAGPDELPLTLRDVLLARVERLSPATQGLLRVAAAAGRSVPDALLAAVAGLDDESLKAALREAVEHHLLLVDESGDGYAFRHALTRDAVYGDILPRERVDIHAAYAAALSEDPALAGAKGSPAAALALHSSAAHDLPRALEAYVEAGRLAAAYAPAEALRHLEHALELWRSVPDATERCGVDIVELLRLAGGSAYACGKLDRSIGLFDEALAELGPDGDPERRALVMEAGAVAIGASGREPEAIARLERAVALLPVDPPTTALAVALTSLAALKWLGGDFQAGAGIAQEAVTAARASGAREQEANAAIILGSVHCYLGEDEGVGEVRTGVELAEAVGDLRIAMRGYLMGSDVLEMLGRHEEAADMARGGLALAERTGLSLHVYGALLVVNRAESLFHLGAWAEAEDTIAAGFDRGIEGRVAGALFQLRAGMLALRGRLDDAAQDLQAATSRGGWLGTQYSLQVAGAAAEILRARGDFAAARARVAEKLDPDAHDLMERYRWPLAWLGLRIEAEAAEPDADRVAALSARCETLQAMTPPQRAYRALAAAEVVRAGGEPADWRTAVESCREAGDPYLIAYALVRMAEVAGAAGDRDAAAAPLEEAVRIAEALGATPLLEEARAFARHARVQLDGVTAPSGAEAGDDPFGLTEREREVLALVAEGRSNPEIAKTLYMSPKTASVHVSNIMGKLGVANRGEAAAFAHRHGLAVSLES